MGRAICRGGGRFGTVLSKATTTATARTAKGPKEIGLDWQLKNNKFARASCVFVHFFAVVERLRRATS